MYLNPPDNTWVVDIETDDLNATVVWCLCAKNIKTGEERTYTDYKEIQAFIGDVLASGGCCVGHNFLSFDAPVLNRLVGTRIPISRICDTFLLSSLYSPSMAGGHSLDAWGQRLKFPKTSFNDWSKLSEEMLRYCLNDVRVNTLMYKALTKRMLEVGFSERSCEIEHKSWAIIQKQRKNGFQLDVPKAHSLYAELRAYEKELQGRIYEQWPPKLQELKHYKKARKANGDFTKDYLRHREQFPEVTIDRDGSYRTYDYVAFNLGSPKQRIEKLLELGWKPREFTPRTPSGGGGNPQATRKGKLVPSLQEFVDKNDVPEVRLLADWISINARGNMVSNWLDLADDKGLIHGNLWLAGTLRYRHDKPNTANIPAVRIHEEKDESGAVVDSWPLLGREGQYTYEARDVWTVRDVANRSLVGVDAKGIQLRVLAHYLNNPVFTDAILSSDPHAANQKAFDLPSRALTKTITYACVPMDTRALTKRGWLSYDEITTDDWVLSFNSEEGIKEWTRVLEKVKYDKAPIIEMGHNQTFKFRSTPNHRWYLRQRKYNQQVRVLETQQITSMQHLITNAPMREEIEGEGVKDFLSLPKYETDWTSVVLQMTQAQRKAFLAGFCIADGFMSGDKWGWSQLDGPLYEAALLATYLVCNEFVYTSPVRVQSNGKTMKRAVCNNTRMLTTAFFKFEKKPEEAVWCIRTANETWVARQGDVITITGNTLMGAGDAKIASEAKVSLKEARHYKEMFFSRVPELRKLINRLQHELRKTGRITLCDGARVLVPSDHMVIPYLLQGDESRIMKQAGIYVDSRIRQLGLDALKCGDIHDEWQTDVRNDDVGRFIEVCRESFAETGRSFNYNLPIDCDTKVGKTWAETH